MTDTFAILTLSLYAAIAGVCIWRHRRYCADGWQVWVLHLIARVYTPLMFRERLRSGCPLPAEGPGLVIGNHRSPVDPILIWSASCRRRTGFAIRRIEFLTAREYCELGGFLGWITRSMRVIPVERDGRDMRPVKQALRRLQDGALVGLFPEGRINLGTELLPGNPGVAWLALHAGVPVFPVLIEGAPQGDTMVVPFHTFCRVRLRYGDPIDLGEFRGQRITSELLEEVTQRLMHALASLAGKSSEADAPSLRRPLPVARVG